jgi:para-nitrobenzyl esterase
MTTFPLRCRPAIVGVAVACLSLGAFASAARSGVAAATSVNDDELTVTTENGVVHGLTVPGAFAFLGLPYAAPPTGNLRWQAPEPPASWNDVRDASEFAPSCPQQAGPFAPPGSLSEDCLYLNVYTPELDDAGGQGRPVIVWIHGGGLATDAARNYDPTELAAEGTVVVTINYRLGALGFLSHPALAAQPGGPSGNHGLMDQQAALRWVRHNIGEFGGDPNNVTIAGQSAGGLSVLAHLTSPGSRDLFDKAIVQSGSFALTQLSLADAEAFGQAFASNPNVGCADQTAECLRNLPVDTLVNNFPTAAIPGVVDGDVLIESIGAALGAGRFAPVPVLNGIDHIEELIFVAGLQLAVNGGSFVVLDPPEVTDDNYQEQIMSTLGVSAARATAIAAEYPTSSYPSPTVAFSVLVSDANFACPALQTSEWTAALAPTFAYEFADDTAPPRYAPLPVATHGSELPYLFDLPNAPLQDPLNADQLELAHTMRDAWANFAATGDPSTDAVPWASFDDGGQGLSFVTPEPQNDTEFASRHHCAFWAAG